MGHLKKERHFRTISEVIANNLLVQANVDTLFANLYLDIYELNGLCPFQLTYGRSRKVLFEIETNPKEGIFGS